MKNMGYNNILDLIEDYLNYIKLEKKLSLNTQNNYKLDLYNYLDYLKKRNISNVNSITIEDINDYLKELHDNGLVSRSIARHITTIKEFHKYLFKIGSVLVDVSLNIENMKQSKHLPTVINQEDMKKILDVKLTNPFKYRDKAMLELMYGSGLRVSELVNLTVYSIDFENDIILIEEKGSKERIVPINKYAKEALLEYLEIRGELIKRKNGNPDKLFLNNHGRGITRQGFNLILKNIL